MTWFLYAIAVAAIALPLGVWLHHDLREAAAARRRRRALYIHLSADIDQFTAAMRRASAELTKLRAALKPPIDQAAERRKR